MQICIDMQMLQRDAIKIYLGTVSENSNFFFKGWGKLRDLAVKNIQFRTGLRMESGTGNRRRGI